jgi:hypothetical protein
MAMSISSAPPPSSKICTRLESKSPFPAAGFTNTRSSGTFNAAASLRDSNSSSALMLRLAAITGTPGW